MDQIKEAFQKVKQEIRELQKEVVFLELVLAELKDEMGDMKFLLEEFRKKVRFLAVSYPAQLKHNQIDPIENPADNIGFKPLKGKNIDISMGNEGVPTDRQTDRQTDRHIENIQKRQENPIQDAAKILDSLDSLKKEIRLKFKRLTEKEMLVFSTLYQLDEEEKYADYRSLAQKLNLTESSIRDYVLRLINKGIPVEKKKINNKQIRLSISQNLKRVVSLSSILQLRDI